MGNALELQAPQTEHCGVLALWLTSDSMFLPSYVQNGNVRYGEAEAVSMAGSMLWGADAITACEKG
jgi:hypothetical protein